MLSFELKLNEQENGFICLSENENEKAIAFYKAKNPKTVVTMENEVSDDFRGYYFAGVIGFIHELKMYPQLARYSINFRSDGYSLVDAYHELLKRDFNGIHIQNNGVIEKFGKSIAVKDSGKFTEYINRISAYTSENFGISVPTPDEYRQHSRMKEKFSRFYIDNQDLFGMKYDNET